MVNRPGNFDITTPTGASSPRSGDDELRKIKEYTQNAYRDLTEPQGASNSHTALYGTEITASSQFTGNLVGNSAGTHTGPSNGAHNGTVGDTNPDTGVFTTATANGTPGDAKGFKGDLEGNADTASEWETERTITAGGDISGVVAVKGDEDETFTMSVESVQPNSVNLGTDTVGSYVEQISGTANEVEVSTNNTEGSNVTIGLPNTINADTTGNAATATALETERSIGLSGDVSGSAMFDGTAAITIATTIQPNSVALGTDTTGNYMANVQGTANEITVSHTQGEGSTATISLPATINVDTTGSAATADRLTTARTISLTNSSGNGVTGSASFDGSGNIMIDTTLVGSVAQGSIESANTLTTGRNFSITGDGTSPAVSFNGSGDVSLNLTIPNASTSADGQMSSGDKIRLDGIANNANNYTHPTYAGDDAAVDTGALSGATVISDLDFNINTDGTGHVTDANATVSTRNITLADLGYTGATNANNYTHPTYNGDDASVDTGVLTGATVISDLDFNINTDGTGHVTDANATVSTRNLTLANLGYTGATDANNYSHPSHTSRSINTSGATVLDTFTSDSSGHVTGITTRNLTAANVGAAATSHNHAASAITSGSFATARIPNLNASKITAGTFADGRIPSLNASKTTAGRFNTARLGTGTASSNTFLRGDGSWQTPGGGMSVIAEITTNDANGAATIAVQAGDVLTIGNFNPRGGNDRDITGGGFNGYGIAANTGNKVVGAVFENNTNNAYSGTILHWR